MQRAALLTCALLVTFNYFHLFHLAHSLTSTPNNNEVYGKTCSKELEANELLHTYETSNSGCTLDCYILKSQNAFYTRSETRRHLLSNIQCINDTYVSTIYLSLVLL